jgi:hypothetical protein
MLGCWWDSFVGWESGAIGGVVVNSVRVRALIRFCGKSSRPATERYWEAGDDTICWALGAGFRIGCRIQLG